MKFSKCGLIACGLSLSVLSLQKASATDRQWTGATSGAWNLAANWTSGVPTGSGDTGVFTGTPTTNTALTFTANATVGQVRFDLGALAYTFTIQNTRTFTLNNAGIVNNSVTPQVFTTNVGGTLTFSTGAGTSSGGATLNNSGTLNFNNTSTASTSPVTNSGTLNFNNTSTASTSSITNSGTLNFTGTSTAGSATITNNGTLNISTTASLGTPTINNNNALNFTVTTNGVGATVNNNALGTLSITGGAGVSVGSLISPGTISLGTRRLTIGALNQADSISGPVSGTTGGLTKTGTNTLTISTAPASLTYAGGTTISDGTLAGFLPTNTALTVTTPGIYNLNGSDKTIGSLVGTGFVNLGGSTLTTGGNNTSTTFSGQISGTGRVTKVGTLIFTLSGANTYTGLTTVSAGTLTLASTGSLAGAVQVDGGTTFSVAGTLSASNPVTNDGTLNFTGTPTATAATITNNGALSIAGTTATGVSIGSIIGAGTVALGTRPLTLFAGNIGGVISSTSANGRLIKDGAGTLTITTLPTYTGTTTLNNGTLAGFLPTATALTIIAGTYDLNGSNKTIGSLTSASSMAAVSLGGSTLTTGNAATTTYAGSFSGLGGGLTKAGGGVFNFSGIGAHTGLTTVSGGTFSLTGSLSGPVTVNAATTFNVTGTTLSASTPIANSGTTNFTTTTSTGGAGITNSGTVNFNNSASASTSTITNNAGRTINFNNTTTASSSNISNSGTINFNNSATAGLSVITNTGTVDFDTDTTADNATIINNAGSVNIAGRNLPGMSIGSLSGAGSVVLGSRALTLGGLEISDIISGIISGVGGSIIKIGTDMLTLLGVNTYSGGTTINAGILAVNNNGNLGSVAGALTFGGGTLRALGAFSSARGITLNAGGGTIDTNSNNLTFTGVIGGASGALTKTGTGTLTFNGGANNTYGGGTFFNGGILAVDTDGKLGTGNLTFGGGTLQLLAGFSSSKGITLNAGGGEVDTNGFAATLSGLITGVGSFIKSGLGNLTLSAANDYQGTTTISAGTLTLTGDTGSLGGEIVDNGALVFDQAAAGPFDFSNRISGTGTVSKTGAATLRFNGALANTYSGGTFIDGGIFAVNSDGKLGTVGGDLTFGTSGAGTLQLLAGGFLSNRAIVLNGFGGTIDTNGFGGTLNGLMSGTGSFRKTGTGTLTITTLPTYTGTTTIDGGVLAGLLPTNTALTINGTGIYDLNGGDRTIGSLTGGSSSAVNLGAFTLTTGGNGGTTTYAGSFFGTSGGLTKAGIGTFNFSGVGTYTGTTTVSGGTFSLTGVVGGPIVVNLGTIFNFSGSTLSTSNPITNSGTTNFTSMASTGGAGITNTGTGTFSFSDMSTASTSSILNNGTFSFNVSSSIGSPSITNGNVLNFLGTSDGAGATVANSGAVDISGTTVGTSIGSLFGSGSIDLGSKTLMLGALNTLDTISGVISGALGSLIKIGTNTLRITQTPTYGGPTSINTGIIEGLLPSNTALTVSGQYNLTANQTIGSLTGAGLVNLSAFTLTTGGNNTSTTFDGVISGSGGLTKDGTGTFTLTGFNTYTGPTIVNGGNLIIVHPTNTTLTVNAPSTYILPDNQSIGALQGTGTVQLQTFKLTTGGNNASTIFSGVIAGTSNTASLTKVGSGNFRLEGANTYTGTTTVSQGSLTLAGSLAGAVIVNGGAIFNVEGATLSASNPLTNSGTTNFSGAANATNASITNTIGGVLDISGLTTTGLSIGSLISSGSINLGSKTLTLGGLNTPDVINGSITGTGGLVKIGTNVLTINMLPSYTGPTTIDTGTIQGLLSMSTALTVNAGGQYALTGNQIIGSLAGSGAVNLGNFTLTTGGNGASTAYSGTLSGAGGGLTKTGSGTFTLSGAGITYGGPTSVSAGTLAGVLPSTTALTVSGGATYSLNGADRTIRSLAGTGTVSLGNFTLTTGTASSSFGGIISGAGGLRKVGAGTFVLTGSGIIYGGNTAVEGGTLAGRIPTGTALTVSGGATYALNGANQTIGSLAGAGNIDLGASTLTTGGNNTTTLYSGSIFGLGGLIKEGTGTFTLTGLNTYTGPTTINAGVLAGRLPSMTALTVNSLGRYDLTTNQTIGSLAGSGPVNLGAFTLTTGGNNTSTTYSGLLSGTGGVTKEGTGTFTPTNTNTYTGTTVINGGTLAVSNNGNLGNPLGGLAFGGGTLKILANGFSSARAISLNPPGGRLNTNGNNATLTGNITGLGGFVKAGLGNLTLTGTNTYTGGTLIEQGSITGNTTSLRGNFINNGALIFNQPADGTFAGNISGTGAVTKNDAGNLTFTGVNSYTGGTTINAGTLTGNSSSLVGNIIDNGSLVFNQITNGTFAGNVSGAGSIVKDEPGILFLTGNFSNFTGAVTIRRGEIEMTTVNVPQNFVIEAAGLLDFAPPSGQTVTFNGTITGAGRVEMEGEGLVSFPSTYTYTGRTNLRNGTLSLDGSLPASALFVKPGGTLIGNGSALRGSIEGLISPGHSIGTLTFDTTYTMAPMAIYKAEIGLAGASDLIRVGTIAALNGTLNVVSVRPRPQLRGQTYIILTAGQQRIGTFSTQTSDDRIKYTVEYLPNAVRIVTGNFQTFSDAFAPNNMSNPALMARYLDSFDDSVPLGTDLDSVLRVLDTYLANEDLTGLAAALDQMQPSLFREFGFLSFNHNALVNKALHVQQQHLRDTALFEAEARRFERIDPKRLQSFHKLVSESSGRMLSSHHSFAGQTMLSKRSQKKFGAVSPLALNNQGAENQPSGMPINQRINVGNTTMWIQSYGQLDNKGGNTHGNVNINSRTGGMSLGADYQIRNDTFVGFMGGYSTTSFDWKQNRGNGRMNSGYGGVYGSWLGKCGLYAEGQLIAGNDRIKSRRNIAFSTINRTAHERHNAPQFSTNGEVGYVVPLTFLTLQPFFNATYMLVHERGYREGGADSLDLQIKAKTSQFFRGELGTMMYQTFAVGDALIRPSIELGWVQKRPVGSQQAQMKGGLVGEPQTLTVFGDNRVRNQLGAGVSLSAQFREGVYVVGNLNSEVGSHEKMGEALLTLGYQF